MQAASSQEASTSAVCLSAVSSQSQACSLLTCAIQHLLFAKGQVSEPISVLQARRARERLSESQQVARLVGGPARSKQRSFSQRRRVRKVDELLVAINHLSQDIASAAHGISAHAPELTDLTLLLRFGQSRLSSRQQIRLSLRHALSLPPNEPALQDSKARRQKMGVLERKLVRFLLGASVDDEDFARVLNGPLGPTRAHVFLLAPTDFSCRRWTKQKSSKLPEQRESAVPARRPTAPETPLHITPSPPRNAAPRPVGEHPVEAQEDMDAKRLKRLQLLADQRKAKRPADGQALRNVEARRGFTKRRPLSASLAIDCNGADSEEQGALRTELHWFACKTVLKGIA